MGQRVIIDANNNVRVIDTGPIGPPGISVGNETISVGALISDETTLPPGVTIADLLASPNPTPTGHRVAVINSGPYDGIYHGQAGEGDPQPLIRVSGLPGKIVIAAMHVVDVTTNPEVGPWITTFDSGEGFWSDAVKFVQETQPGPWIEPYLLPPWANADSILETNTGLPEARWRVNQATKRVEIEFAVGGGALNSHIFQLPDELIPDRTQTFTCNMVKNDLDGLGVCVVSVDQEDGWVTFVHGAFLSVEDGVVALEAGEFFVIANFSYGLT